MGAGAALRKMRGQQSAGGRGTQLLRQQITQCPVLRCTVQCPQLQGADR